MDKELLYEIKVCQSQIDKQRLQDLLWLDLNEIY